MNRNDSICSSEFYRDTGFDIIRNWLKDNCRCSLNQDFFTQLTPLIKIQKISDIQDYGNEFLSALSLFEKPDLDFQDDYVVITEEGSAKSLKYWYSDPSVVTTPTKDITMPSNEVQFDFSSDSLAEITKAASVIGAPDMVLEKGKLRVTDKKNTTANDYATELDVPENDVDYKFWFKVENLKLLPGSYSVEVSSKNISRFSNSNVDIEYFIALEPESSYAA